MGDMDQAPYAVIMEASIGGVSTHLTTPPATPPANEPHQTPNRD